MNKQINNRFYSIQDKWLRITQNPIISGYPKSGDIIFIQREFAHYFPPTGKYLVLMVEEFEPGMIQQDNIARDIRFDLVPEIGSILRGITIDHLDWSTVR